VECRRYGWAVSGAECGVKWAPSQLGLARDTSRSRSIRKKNSLTSSRPGIGSLALATGSLHPFSPSPPTGRPRPAAPVAVSLRTPALPPREQTLDCASQRLRHPPRQILSNQSIDPLVLRRLFAPVGSAAVAGSSLGRYSSPRIAFHFSKSSPHPG
jgi:hypothetical protein